MDSRIGSIEVGKEGDVVVFDQHPLSIYAIPQLTIVDGVVRFDRKNDPADMRMEVDPAQPVPSFFREDRQQIDRCMQGTEELWKYLFENEHK